jgi:hypothetical protein
MKKARIIALLTTAVFLAAVIAAGCTQEATGTSAVPAGNSQQVSQPGGISLPPSGNDAARGSGPGGDRQFSGQNFLTNQTRIAAAADKLGVSASDLQNALDWTKNATSGRPDLNAAAQELGITRQQLSDALGIPATNRTRSGGYNATRTP